MTKQLSNTNILKIKKVETLIGNTPLYPIQNIFRKKNVKIYAKLEWQQLGNSVKARPAFNIIKEALLNGDLKDDKILLDASSGNTGIAYGAIGAALGVKVKLVLPENASEARKKILRALGVDLIFSSRFESTDGAQILAKEILAENPERYYYADQYSNENNWKAHYNTTAREIWNQTGGRVTHFVAGLGTTGTFVGTSRGLLEQNPDLINVALQPDNPMHGLEGWKHLETAIIPPIYDKAVPKQFAEVSTEESLAFLPEIARKEGLLVSPSAAANLLGAIRVAESIDEGVIVTTFADDASKYEHL